MAAHSPNRQLDYPVSVAPFYRTTEHVEVIQGFFEVHYATAIIINEVIDGNRPQDEVEKTAKYTLLTAVPADSMVPQQSTDLTT